MAVCWKHFAVSFRSCVMVITSYAALQLTAGTNVSIDAPPEEQEFHARLNRGRRRQIGSRAETKFGGRKPLGRNRIRRPQRTRNGPGARIRRHRAECDASENRRLRSDEALAQDRK